jgi:hypothetical protein
MDRRKFQEAAKIRKKDAQALIRSKQYPGAYYLAGYAIECALKAWSEESRYETTTTDKEAKDLYSACMARSAGLFGWIKKRW